MRILFIAVTALTLSACATQEAAKPAPAASAAPAAAKKVPQCYSSDHSKFFNVGEKTKISGVDVTCEATSDGKNGQWMGKKH